MKAKLIALPLFTTVALVFVGCTTTTQTTANPPPQGVNTVSQTYTQRDLQRSGRATTGPALKTIDPDVQ